MALDHIDALNTWSERRTQLAIDGEWQRNKTWLAKLPYPPSYPKKYLQEHKTLGGQPFVCGNKLF